MDILILLGLLTTGYVFGRIAEKRHFISIRTREEEYRDVLAFSARFPPPSSTPTTPVLVGGNVVVAVDYFKMTAAALRNLIGGRVTSFETLVERARREAILRMKEEARAHGATQIFNVKLETSSIGQGTSGQSFSVEVYAYGTALVAGKTD
ncbi:YbjQ family protein [Alcanivorax sp. 1008]|uniref:YbjQ family protein n=1 Tax=Alcanivorax sp. 1008 TaxID=2816853 RepID=UPI001D5CA5BE|nr:heavy metal-binding domain-containing protein [Alcanivorax sp. 1008]MCC1496960.1 heavy metal-binding domain-containing protein [Alcanivorax sp. 1008]